MNNHFKDTSIFKWSCSLFKTSVIVTFISGVMTLLLLDITWEGAALSAFTGMGAAGVISLTFCSLFIFGWLDSRRQHKSGFKNHLYNSMTFTIDSVGIKFFRKFIWALIVFPVLSFVVMFMDGSYGTEFLIILPTLVAFLFWMSFAKTSYVMTNRFFRGFIVVMIVTTIMTIRGFWY